MPERGVKSAHARQPLRVLLTGAAGFIGTAIQAALEVRGHEVAALDALIPQAHAVDAQPRAGIQQIDVRDGDTLRHVLSGIDVVCHQAAMVGAGVAPADLPRYASHNDLGTAVLLAQMAGAGIKRLVLASSMVVYGDGRYTCRSHGVQTPSRRRLRDLDEGRFDVTCPECGTDLDWQLVDEEAPLVPRSSYAASKVAQEHYSLAWSRQTAGGVIALRYHNAYGPGMPQDTPYSGVAAIFRSALERRQAPRVYEDGGQMRDFVHVSDVAEANVLAIEEVGVREGDSFSAYNVCSGQPVSILEVAKALALAVPQTSAGREAGQCLSPVVTGDYRAGDVRHVVASPRRATAELGFTAAVGPEDGLAEFASAPLRAR